MSRIQVSRITINTPEGMRRPGMRFPMHVEPIAGGPSVWIRASTILHEISRYCPATMGYDKTSFRIDWENGESYEGRLDIKHYSLPNNDTDLSDHIVRHIKFYSGKHCPPHMNPEQYKEFMSDMGNYKYVPVMENYLEHYDLGPAYNEE